VLLVTKPLSPPWNDSGKVVPRDLARGGPGRHELGVLTARGDHSPWPERVRAHAVYAPARAGRGAPLARLRMMAAVWRRRREFDALHFFFQPHPAAARAARLLAAACGAPAIHTALSAPREDLDAARVRFAPLTIALSCATARRLECPGAAAPRVIPARTRGAGADLRYAGRGGARGRRDRRAFRAVSGRLRLLGRLRPAARRVGRRARSPGAAARRARQDQGGGGKRAPGSSAAPQRSGSARGVRFAGTVEDMPALIAASDGVLFPARSLYAKSDVPIVLLEAWRAARPVWVSGLPPLAELAAGITEAVPDEPAAWAAAARSIPSEGPARGEAGARGCWRATPRATMRAAYEAVYDELEAGRAAARAR
jgi:hypothetical protein